MLPIIQYLAELAVDFHFEKEAKVRRQYARSGRNCKGSTAIAKHLEAAGSARQNVAGIMPFARGRQI